jgi:V8-like Glu-specific endopeptidase
MSKLSLVFGLSVSLFGCLDGAAPTNSDENIIGGQPDAGDPSVVQIRFSEESGGNILTAACTATVISPTVLLTAAHCAVGWNYEYNPAQNADPFGTEGGWTAASYALANPLYSGDPQNGGHDVAVVILASPIATAPSALGTVPSVGQTVRAVGYGLQQAGGGGNAGSKQQKSFPVASISTHEWVAGPNDTCHGDSGGPVFDASGAIIGTTSYGDNADCNGNDHFMRIDDNLAWLQQAIATYGGGGSGGSGGSGGGSGGGGGTTSCDVSQSDNGSSVEVACTNGACECYQDGVLTSTCTDNGAGCSIPGSCCGF